MPIHAEPRRKHRKRNGSRLTETVCASLAAYNVIMQDCDCGKKCLDMAVRTSGIDTVFGVIKYCQSEVHGKTYGEKYDIIRQKVEGVVKVFHLIICAMASHDFQVALWQQTRSSLLEQNAD
jgi:hypothetical protein